jgi:hypothetical protein
MKVIEKCFNIQGGGEVMCQEWADKLTDWAEIEFSKMTGKNLIVLPVYRQKCLSFLLFTANSLGEFSQFVIYASDRAGMSATKMHANGWEERLIGQLLNCTDVPGQHVDLPFRQYLLDLDFPQWMQPDISIGILSSLLARFVVNGVSDSPADLLPFQCLYLRQHLTVLMLDKLSSVDPTSSLLEPFHNVIDKIKILEYLSSPAQFVLPSPLISKHQEEYTSVKTMLSIQISCDRVYHGIMNECLQSGVIKSNSDNVQVPVCSISGCGSNLSRPRSQTRFEDEHSLSWGTSKLRSGPRGKPLQVIREEGRLARVAEEAEVIRHPHMLSSPVESQVLTSQSVTANTSSREREEIAAQGSPSVGHSTLFEGMKMNARKMRPHSKFPSKKQGDCKKARQTSKTTFESEGTSASWATSKIKKKIQTISSASSVHSMRLRSSKFK